MRLDGLSRFKGEATPVDGPHGRAEAESLWGQVGGELVGNGLHPAVGKGGSAAAEHLEDEFKHAAAGREGFFKKDTFEKRLKKPFYEGLTEAETCESLARRDFGVSLNAFDGGKGEAGLKGSYAELIGEGSRRRAESRWELGRLPERINEAEEAASIPNEGAGEEPSES